MPWRPGFEVIVNNHERCTFDTLEDAERYKESYKQADGTYQRCIGNRAIKLIIEIKECRIYE